MDNLTHSLVGATLAELALPAGAPRPMRRAFFVAGIVAANLPDADLVYTRITPAPLGSLLHHRGHTHTVAGLLALGVAMAAVYFVPRLRAAIEPARGRLLALIAVALASHLVLDSWNSYGVHPFWPVDARWFYGDAVFILEPWLWMLLAVGAGLNTRNRWGRATLALVLAGLFALGAYMRVFPLAALAAIALTAGGLMLVLRSRAPRTRSAIVIALATCFVALQFALRESARAKVVAATEPALRAGLVDVVLSPEPANPFCWTALTVARDPSGATAVMTHGRAALIAPSACGRDHARDVVWDPPRSQSLAELRQRYAADCWVRAWLQFGRAPHIAAGAISDVRYGNTPRGNFTTMELRTPAEAARCPANLTAWRPPRADLLQGTVE